MELRQLEQLVAVAEEGSFTRAAARLHVAQPGVSAQVRRLEAELGQELLDRSGPGVRPTVVGAAVLPHARAALAAVRAVRATVDEHDGLLRGRVAVGAITSTQSDLPGLLAAFHQEHPDVELSLVEGASDLLVSRLREGSLDLALLALTGPAPAGLALHDLGSTAFVAAVPPDHRLARRTTVRLAELATEPLACLPRGTAVRTTLERAAAAAGIPLRVAYEAGSPGAVAELARRGLGIAVVPASIGALADGTLHGIAITGPELRGRLALAWREAGAPSPAARAFVAHARAVLVTG